MARIVARDCRNGSVSLSWSKTAPVAALLPR
jgi:hypothetical protein